MRVAFHAPLKPPDHPLPSGDRRMARSFVELLAGLGHEVELACHFRSYDRNGDAARQERLAALGARLAEGLVRRYRRRPARAQSTSRTGSGRTPVRPAPPPAASAAMQGRRLGKRR